MSALPAGLTSGPGPSDADIDASPGSPVRSAPARRVGVSFIAVEGPDPPIDVEAARTEQRHRARDRLKDAAKQSVMRATPALSTIAVFGFGLALAVAVADQVDVESGVFTLIAAGAVAALPRLLPLSMTVRHRAYWVLGVFSVAALMIWPWLQPPGASPRMLWLTALVLSALATTGAAALATVRPLGIGTALVPLPAALCACRSWQAGSTSDSMVIAGCVFASFAAGLVFIAARRAGRRSARALIERDDRIQGLIAARDAALRGDEEKSRFLAIASHDLRQPVHALGLFAATLDKRLQGTREEPLVRNMIRSIDGLDRSFNAMLDVSRLDAGTIQPNVQHFPLRDLFRRLHMHFAGQAELRDLGLRFWPGGKAISSDPQLLERVLGNLVQNAIKYTAEGGVVIVARSTSTHINVEIWDTGAGIDPVALPRIFDEFYQVGRGEHSRAQGLGMGLAIVKRLCRLLGHRLSVSSVPGRGTMFRVGIPVSGMQDIEAATAAADTRPMPVTQSRTVLIIDDEEAIREGLRLLLEEWGYEAVAAGSIAEAMQIAVLMIVPPDLVLSDLHLGDGPDGIAAIAALRKQWGHDVHAVLITGDTSQEEAIRIADSGHPVLFKPVQPRKLYGVVHDLIP